MSGFSEIFEDLIAALGSAYKLLDRPLIKDLGDPRVFSILRDINSIQIGSNPDSPDYWSRLDKGLAAQAELFLVITKITEDFRYHVAADLIETLRELVRSMNPFVEANAERFLATRLQESGYSVHRQVGCQAGTIDILGDDFLIEVKAVLDRPSIFQAVGQVVLYSASLGGNRTKKIAGRATTDLQRLRQFIELAGVEVVEL